MLIGQPGYGKSMLLNKIKFDWTNSVLPRQNGETEHISEDIIFTKKYDILIYIDLSKCSSNDTIADCFKAVANTEESLSYLEKESSECLFILDSWDEFAWKEMEGHEIVKLSNGHIFKACTVIIASKLADQTLLPDYKDKTCIIQGFTQDQQARTFVQKYCDKENVLRSFEIENVSQSLGTELITDPFMLHAACFLFKNGVPLTDSLSSLFTKLVLITIKQAKSRSAPKISSLDDCKTELLSIGKLALTELTNTENQKRVLTEEKANTIEAGRNLGLLHGIPEESQENPVQVTFPHSRLKEFLAAIYVVSEKEGFSILDKYIQSLVRVHDLQKLITFICGLSNETGYHLMNKVITMGQNNPPFGADCQNFCWAGWAKPDYIWVQLHTREAENITPFILNCLWEIWRRSDSQNIFPFSANETATTEVVSLQPDLNFKMISLKKVNQLYEMGAVKFDKGNVMHLYNLNDDESIKEDPTFHSSFYQKRQQKSFVSII